MKITKEQIGNVIWIVAILLILFTPLGFHVRVWVNKVVATVISPSTVDEREQAVLENYHWELIDMEGHKMNLKSKEGPSCFDQCLGHMVPTLCCRATWFCSTLQGLQG
jgi:hypothetical protein